MAHNNSDQVKMCMSSTGNKSTEQPLDGGTSQKSLQNDSGSTKPTSHPTCSKPGDGGASNQHSPAELRDKRAAHQHSQTESIDRGSGRVSSLGACSSGLPSEPVETYPFSYLKKLPECAMRCNQHLDVPEEELLIDKRCFLGGLIAPKSGEHFWNSHFVKLPHLYPSQRTHPPSSQPPHRTQHAPLDRWRVTCRVLEQLTRGHFSVGDIQSAIMAYNSDYKNKWTFEVLQYYCQKLQKENDLNEVIPNIAKLALDLPALIGRAIPLLRQQQHRAITLSQQQISCLLANAFFCTFPHRNNTKPGSEYANFPTINFSSLFGSHSKDLSKEAQKIEKLRAIFHYFRMVTKAGPHVPPESKPDGLVTFERVCIDVKLLPKWKNEKKAFRNLHVSARGYIEKEGAGLLQVDFASKFIGGGVLGSGLVQEEILFLMSPELIVARLFTEKLADNECLKITGAQIYSMSSGYSGDFEWAGPHHDTTKRDNWKRRYRQIVAIDALNFKDPKEQYTKENIERELNKAYVGFRRDPNIPAECQPDIATGNWGCGAFGGDPKLKALIQLMAAAVAGRDMAYFTFDNEQLAKDIKNMYHQLIQNKVTVDKLHKVLVEFCGHAQKDRHSQKDLYEYIFKKIGAQHSQL